MRPVMPERPSGRLDWVAWVLLLCGMLVAACAFSHEPGTGSGAAPNLLGPPGDWLAHELSGALVRRGAGAAGPQKLAALVRPTAWLAAAAAGRRRGGGLAGTDLAVRAA